MYFVIPIALIPWQFTNIITPQINQYGAHHFLLVSQQPLPRFYLLPILPARSGPSDRDLALTQAPASL